MRQWFNEQGDRRHDGDINKATVISQGHIPTVDDIILLPAPWMECHYSEYSMQIGGVHVWHLSQELTLKV